MGLVSSNGKLKQGHFDTPTNRLSLYFDPSRQYTNKPDVGLSYLPHDPIPSTLSKSSKFY
jgi:hypothetical protein